MVIDIPAMLKKDFKESKNYSIDYRFKTIKDIQIPDFFREGTNIDTKCISLNTPKSSKEKLSDKIEEYFYKTRKTTTRLLYAIYYLSTKNEHFDFSQFIKFLNYNRDVLQYDEKYQQLTCIIYQITNNKDVYSLLTTESKKLVDNKEKIYVDIKELSDFDVESISNTDKIEENIDEILWYLYNNKTIKTDFGSMDIPTFLKA